MVGGGRMAVTDAKARAGAPQRDEVGSGRSLIAGGLLALSGAAALIYQVIWIKQLSLVVGVEVHAIATAVGAFFAGLGLGGWLLGRLADRVSRPAMLYGVLEVAVAAFGIATTLTLSVIAPVFAKLEMISAFLAWPLIFLLVGLPAFLMGGTLPSLVRTLSPDKQQIGGVGGFLYASNTAGAIIGALLPAFVLIPAFGVQGSAIAAAIMNIVAGVAARALDRKPAVRKAAALPEPERLSGEARLALVLYGVAGGIALGYEVIWSQVIVQFISTRSFAFSIILATYLGGLVIGSALIARYVDRSAKPWLLFGLLISGAGLVALSEVAFLGRWLVILQTQAEAATLRLGGSPMAGMSARFAVAAACIVLIPTIMLGAAFPLALRLVSGGKHVGRDVGILVAFNTLGGIVGSLVTGFVLIPWLGLVHTLSLLAVAAALVGLVAALREADGRIGLGATGVLAAATVVVAIMTPKDRLSEELTRSRGGTLIAYEEGQGGTVAVIEQSLGRNAFRRLYIQGVSNSGDAMPSRRYMRLQALLPLIVHADEPRSALVIGFGTGITAGALLQYPPLERRVVAELLPAVVRAAGRFEGNYGAGTDPRLDVRLRDGRRELLRTEERYDLITLEPPPPSAAGVVNLYSRDFYELAAQRMGPRGIVAQWLPIHAQNDEDTRSLVRAFLDVFPHASLWSTDLHEMMLIGSAAPLELDVNRIQKRLDQPEVGQALREVGIGSVAALLATYVTDRKGLERYVGDAPAVTDDNPRIEYGTWLRSGEFERVLRTIFALNTPPMLANANDRLLQETEAERERLYTFYMAGLNARAGQRAEWARGIARILHEDGSNPYYLWFTGGARQAPQPVLGQ